MMRGEWMDFSEQELNAIAPLPDFISDAYLDYIGTPLYSSEFFRRQCINAGYHLTNLYPVYHQGWEMDEWGAMATKDGKTYALETNHGSLVAHEQTSLVDDVMDFFRSLIS